MKVLSCPRYRPILFWTLAIQLVLCGTGVYADDATGKCKLLSEPRSDQKTLKRLAPLVHKNFTAKTQNGTESYTYIFGFCEDAGGVSEAGVIQIDNKQKKTVIGRNTAVQAIGGSDWVMLFYRNGEKYDAHCSQEPRKAMVMITCDRNVDMGNLRVVLEDRERNQECFYLFEMDSSAVCPTLESKLSAGSIILIIGFCLLAVYLIGGFLYQRLVVGAKGMEQFPNYAFWVEVGNLSADGCDFVCRSRNREEPPAYRGLATEPLEEEPEERDDHLLPM